MFLSLQPGLSETTKIRKRRRVLKSRTFVDEEGCIGKQIRNVNFLPGLYFWFSCVVAVTEKGYESESYSEDESAAKQAPTKNQAKTKTSASNEKKSQKKMAENKTTKQASIMGFFQKKWWTKKTRHVQTHTQTLLLHKPTLLSYNKHSWKNVCIVLIVSGIF